MAHRTAHEINTDLQRRYPVGCRVQFHRSGCGFNWPTAVVVGYRRYAHGGGVKTLVVEMEEDRALRWEAETHYLWRAGQEYHLTGGDQAYLSKLPDRQRELAV